MTAGGADHPPDVCRLAALAAGSALGCGAEEAPLPALIPEITDVAWVIAEAPDLGHLGGPAEVQVVDFAIWQAADGAWQLQSCIRRTGVGGHGRLLYRWQGERLTDAHWRAAGGVDMQADPGLGETPGGLQAPFVLPFGDEYRMFYGDWQSICQAVSHDGKSFERLVQANGKTGMFSEGDEANTRDPMVLRVGDEFVLYYSAHPGGQGAVYARSSRGLVAWGPSRLVATGGEAGSGPFAAECPFVAYNMDSGAFYLFRTQRYDPEAETRVYRSTDPFDFDVNDDRLVTLFPFAAPELIEHQGATFIATLLPDLQGIGIAPMRWTG